MHTRIWIGCFLVLGINAYYRQISNWIITLQETCRAIWSINYISWRWKWSWLIISKQQTKLHIVLSCVISTYCTFLFFSLHIRRLLSAMKNWELVVKDVCSLLDMYKCIYCIYYLKYPLIYDNEHCKLLYIKNEELSGFGRKLLTWKWLLIYLSSHRITLWCATETSVCDWNLWLYNAP